MDLPPKPVNRYDAETDTYTFFEGHVWASSDCFGGPTEYLWRPAVRVKNVRTFIKRVAEDDLFDE